MRTAKVFFFVLFFLMLSFNPTTSTGQIFGYNEEEEIRSLLQQKYRDCRQTAERVTIIPSQRAQYVVDCFTGQDEIRRLETKIKDLEESLKDTRRAMIKFQAELEIDEKFVELLANNLKTLLDRMDRVESKVFGLKPLPPKQK